MSHVIAEFKNWDVFSFLLEMFNFCFKQLERTLLIRVLTLLILELRAWEMTRICGSKLFIFSSDLSSAVQYIHKIAKSLIKEN